MLNNISNKIDSLVDPLHTDNILKSDIQAYKQEMRDLYLKQNQEMQTFIQNQKQEIMRHINNRSGAIRLDMAESQQSKEGIYHFQYLLDKVEFCTQSYLLQPYFQYSGLQEFLRCLLPQFPRPKYH